MIIEVSETLVWIIVGFALVNVILSSVHIYYRQEVLKTQRGLEVDLAKLHAAMCKGKGQ